MAISVGRMLVESLRAPFTLSEDSLKSLMTPALSLLGAILLLFVFRSLLLIAFLDLLAQLLIGLAMVWLALAYQRQILLGPTDAPSVPWSWRRYGLYSLAVVALCFLLATFFGLLLTAFLPAITWFGMAINSPNPSLALGSVGLGVLVVGVAAYPVLRLSMLMPAAAVDHEIRLTRIWNLSSGYGLKMFVLLGLIPGLISSAKYLAYTVEPQGMPVWAVLLTTLVDAYLVLVFLSMLAVIYANLAGLVRPPKSEAIWTQLSDRNRSKLRWTLLASIGCLVVAAGWHSFYRVQPGEQVVVSRFGKAERIDTRPGPGLKIPGLEKAQRAQEGSGERLTGSGRFVTRDKQTLELRYTISWRVSDVERYVLATGAQTLLAQTRVEELARHHLRRYIGGLSRDEVETLAGRQDGLTIDAKDAPHARHPMGVLLDSLQPSFAEFGLEVRMLKVGMES